MTKDLIKKARELIDYINDKSSIEDNYQQKVICNGLLKVYAELNATLIQLKGKNYAPLS